MRKVFLAALVAALPALLTAAGGDKPVKPINLPMKIRCAHA